MKTFFIFRNHTIEPLFQSIPNITYSDYASIENIPNNKTLVWFYNLSFSQNIKTLTDELKFYRYNIDYIIKNKEKSTPFIIFSLENHLNLIDSNFYLFKIKIQQFNKYIYNLSKTDLSIKFIDLNEFTNNYSYNDLIDKRYYYYGKVYYNPKIEKSFSNYFLRKINSINQKRKKCLVLDLDNTLWGGIIGEDGLSKIHIGDTYPGNCFKIFQQSIKEIKKSGIILTICSKNNETDIEEYWEKHPEVILKKNDFIIRKINWNNKANNIKEISEELNIGLDSLVFLDDNPVERELVKNFLPEVEVPEFPSYPYLLGDFIIDIYYKYFNITDLTKEDKNKTSQYIQNTRRKKLKKKIGNYSSYIKKLNIQISIERANKMNIPRIIQLTQKTNQFNLTTKRYLDSDIEEFIKNNDLVFCSRIVDKFGDNGITNVIIIKLDLKYKSAEIDTFLLSCRVLGRGIEEAILFFILKHLQRMGIKKVKSFYSPSRKNIVAKEFYNKNDFNIINKDVNGYITYNKNLKKKVKLLSSYNIIIK